MSIALRSPAALLPIRGVRIASTSAGIRYKNREDLVLLELCSEANTAVVFTKNQFCAAPIVISKQHLSKNKPKYLLINSGNANAGLGAMGIEHAKFSCNALAKLCECSEEEVLPFSTGVIGRPLPIDKITKKLSELLKELNENGWLKAAHAIMTTDTVAKGDSKSMELDSHTVNISGIAKGAGMIHPNMATMLAFLATDLEISESEIKQILNDAIDQSFHCITVDGDTSTNDACVLIASGKSHVSFAGLSQTAKELFINNLNNVFLNLAQAIVRDGEGVTKFITVKVEQAVDNKSARNIAFTIAHSPLVKTAAFASDPNWGRILAAAGRSEVQELDFNKVSLFINELEVVSNGELATTYTEELGSKEMQKDEIEFRLILGVDKGTAHIWTTDLSYDYVKINAEYRT